MNALDRRRAPVPGIFAVLLSASLLSSARADDQGFRPIFNGKDP